MFLSVSVCVHACVRAYMRSCVHACVRVCGASGYQYAGLEYGAECHCGNRISSPRAQEEDCSLMCRGERGSPCGGVGRVSIYKVEEQLPGHRKCESASLREDTGLFTFYFLHKLFFGCCRKVRY